MVTTGDEYGIRTRVLDVMSMAREYDLSGEAMSKVECHPRDRNACVWPSIRGSKGLIRCASIMGYHTGGNMAIQADMSTDPIPGCVCGYDIETVREMDGGLPMPGRQITSCAASCNCGDAVVWHTLGESVTAPVGSLMVLCADSFEVCERFMDWIHRHRPMWCLSYNGDSFDNPHLAYWLALNESKYEVCIEQVTSSSVFSDKACRSTFRVDGTVFVDLHTHITKQHRSKFERLTLDHVAKKLTGRGKIKYHAYEPQDDGYDASELVRYNLLDAELLIEIWDKLKVEMFLLGVARVMKSPIEDVIGNVTGTMASCLLSSRALCEGRLVDWGKVEWIGEDVRGGMVMDPVVGYHDNVCIVDYGSMYPSIMISCNICVEGFRLDTDHDSSEGSFDWAADDSGTSCIGIIAGTAVHTSRSRTHSSSVMRGLVDTRKKMGRSHPLRTAIKVATNSLYGAMLYTKSPLYSPHAGGMVPMVGRWSIEVASGIVERCGYRVVYGDTDSLFMKALDETVYSPDDVMVCLHAVLAMTPLSSLQMCVESRSCRVGLVTKKRYAIYNQGKLTMKGLSSARKDRHGVCSMFVSDAMRLILSRGDVQSGLMMAYMKHLTTCMRPSVPLWYVSKRVTSDGRSVVRYYDDQSNPVSIPAREADDDAPVKHWRGYAICSLLSEARSLSASMGIGDPSDILGSLTII